MSGERTTPPEGSLFAVVRRGLWLALVVVGVVLAWLLYIVLGAIFGYGIGEDACE